MYTILGMLDSLRSSDQEFLNQVRILESHLPQRPRHPAPPEVHLLCAAGIREEVARLYLVSTILNSVASWGSGQTPDLYREAGLTSGRAKALARLLHNNGYAQCINVPGIEGIVRVKVTLEQATSFFQDLVCLLSSLSGNQRAIPKVGFLNLLYDGNDTLFSNFRFLTQRLRHPEFSELLRDGLKWYTETHLSTLRAQSIPTDYARVRIRRSVLDALYAECDSGDAIRGGLLTGFYDFSSQSLHVDGFSRVPTSSGKHFTYDWDAYHQLAKEISEQALIVAEWHSHAESTELAPADLRKMRQLRRGDWLIVTSGEFRFYAWRGTADNQPLIRDLEMEVLAG